MPQAGYKPGSLSEHLLELDALSKPLGHHGRFLLVFTTHPLVIEQKARRVV